MAGVLEYGTIHEYPNSGYVPPMFKSTRTCAWHTPFPYAADTPAA